MNEYNHKKIEAKWRKRWESSNIYKTPEKPGKKKMFILDAFPGISGKGIHVGHWIGYVLSDVFARYQHLRGKKVLHPIGWDAFGLPVENYAIKNNVHPQIAKNENRDTMRRQFREMSTMYDWNREIDTSEPEFYTWTQWFFLQLYKKKLAYRKLAPVNWCPSCKTVLANEQALESSCERCGTKVTKKKLKQWFFKITTYADRLEKGLDNVDWPERTKKMQRDWIGRSEGMEIQFCINEQKEKLNIFTTRQDTLYGVTFMVLAPEHPLVNKITTTSSASRVTDYIQKAKSKSELQRLEDKKKTGVNTGAFAINPINNEKIPIWVADYVMMSYGTGAIMAVPAHDERDHEFATTYHIPIREVIKRPPHQEVDKKKITSELYTGPGEMIHSSDFNGLDSKEGIKKILLKGKKEDWGKAAVSYKMRDWLFSRQRYWGAPIPMIYCETCGEVPVSEKDLPVLLPENADFAPRDDGTSPLSNEKKFLYASCPLCGKKATRETDTMDGFVCSSWYFLRYPSAHDDTQAFDKELIKQWLPVDFYVIGAEHTVGHLLYSRFFTKFLFDSDYITFEEPFKRLFHPGTIYRDGAKMSKSKGNVVNPDEIIETFGADSLRCYELFMGPADQAIEWSDQGIEGLYRFLGRAHRMVYDFVSKKDKAKNALNDSPELMKLIHKTIYKVTKDIEDFHFNTAISAMMEFVNDAKNLQPSKKVLEDFIVIMSPFAPLVCEEMWEMLGHDGSIFHATWPIFQKELLKNEKIQIAIQINGKLRGTIEVQTDALEKEIIQAAQSVGNVAKHLKEKKIIKTIYIKNRLINFVFNK